MNQYEKDISEIYSILDEPDLSLQLVEEAAELIQALCKLLRIARGSNPTPVTTSEAYLHILEEMADVRVSIDAMVTGADELEIKKIMDSKASRWVHRLREYNGLEG